MKLKIFLRINQNLHIIKIVLLAACILLSVLFTYSTTVIKKDVLIVGEKKPELLAGKISFATWGSPNQMEILKMAAQQFYSQNNIQVDVFCYPDIQSFRTKVISQFAAGDPFNVFYADEYTFLTLAKKGWLMDLTELQNNKRININDYYETAFKKGKINDRLYGIPAGIDPTLIYYNVNLFKEIGINDLTEVYKKGNWNLEYFVKICKQLKDSKKVYGISTKNDWPTIFSMIYNNGGNIFGFINDGSITANKETQDSINEFKYLINNKYSIYMGNMPKGVTEDELFKAQKVAMVYAGYDYAFLFKDIKDFQWDIIPFPSNEKGCGASAIDVPIMSAAKYTKEPEAVKDFILFYAGAQGQKMRLEKGEKILPSLKYTVYLNTVDMALPEHANYYFYSLGEGFVEPNAMNYLQNKDRLLDKFNQVWTGKADLDNVIKVK